MSYVSEVLADAPIHYWTCASAPSPLVQDSGSAPACLVYNDGFQQGGFTGVDLGGWAYYLSANYQIQSSVALPFTSPSSFECWFWLPFLPGQLYELVAWDGLGAGSVNLYIDATNRLSAGGPGATVVDPVPIIPARWHHLVMTYDGASTLAYKDGVAFGGGGAGSLAGFNGGVTIGARFGAGGITGLISSVAQYGVKLSAARVLAHYAAASLKALQPIFLNSGSVNYVTVTEAVPGTQLDAVLAAVRHTYQNAP